MRVLILGGNGFLGRPITHRLLALGADVTVFHRGRGGLSTGLMAFTRSMAIEIDLISRSNIFGVFAQTSL